MKNLGFNYTYAVTWSDVDPNMHMRHTAYFDYADDVRIRMFDHHGFSFLKFRELMMGPVIFSTESTFFKEVELGDSVTIDCKLHYLSEDRRKFEFVHEVFREDKTLAARLRLNGGFLNLRTRRLASPPEEIHPLLDKIKEVTLAE